MRVPVYCIHEIDQETGIIFPLIIVLSDMKIKMLRSQRLPLERISASHTLATFFVKSYGSESVRKGERYSSVRACFRE